MSKILLIFLLFSLACEGSVKDSQIASDSKNDDFSVRVSFNYISFASLIADEDPNEPDLDIHFNRDLNIDGGLSLSVGFTKINHRYREGGVGFSVVRMNATEKGTDQEVTLSSLAVEALYYEPINVSNDKVAFFCIFFLALDTPILILKKNMIVKYTLLAPYVQV